MASSSSMSHSLLAGAGPDVCSPPGEPSTYRSAMDVVRIYTGPDGQSHLEDISIDLADHGAAGRISAPWGARAVQFREVEGDYHLDFHTAPRRQLVVNLTGSVEIDCGNGEARRLGPGTILLADDRTGRGHISRHVGREPRACLFVHLDDVEDG
jgi:hypothetical protein